MAVDLTPHLQRSGFWVKYSFYVEDIRTNLIVMLRIYVGKWRILVFMIRIFMDIYTIM